MEMVSKEVIEVLSYLLPGFITAWIYHGLTSFPKPTQFEKIVQALIFTVIVQVFVSIVQWIALILGQNIILLGFWNKNISLTISIIIALIIGMIFAKYANNDKFHRLLRKLSITKETSFPSEWYGVFSQNKTYVVLHLKNQRKIYGWPEEWPSEPQKGHFSITEAEWLSDLKGNYKRIQLKGVSNILIPANEVSFVEFMEIKEKN